MGWIKVSEKDAPARPREAGGSGGWNKAKDQPDINNREKAQVQRDAARQRSDSAYASQLDARGQAAKDRAKEAKKMTLTGYETDLPTSIDQIADNFPYIKDTGLPSNGLIVAGHEVDKLKAGGGEALDFMRSFIPGQEMKAYASSGERAKEQASLDKFYRELSENAGPSSIAAMAPYLITGRLEPFIGSRVGRILKTINNTATKAATTTGGRFGQAIKRRAARKDAPLMASLDRMKRLTATSTDARDVVDSAITQGAKELESGIVDPFIKISEKFKSRDPIPHRYRKGIGKDMITSAGIGAGEGALHYDDNPVEGAISSVIGTGSGRVINPVASRYPSMNDENTDRIIDWAESKGFRALPGMRSGEPAAQSLEADMRTNDNWSAYMKQIDDHNRAKISNIAGETAGLTPEQMKNITPERLALHKKNLSNEYNKLEEGTRGILDPEELKSLGGGKANINSPNEQKIYLANLKRLHKVLNSQKQGRKNGRFTHKTFDGKSYQSTRSVIKKAQSQAYDQKKYELGDELSKLVKALDSGMERGVTMKYGEATAKEWKDLNERYAMTNLLMEKGMDPLGGIDLNKLESNLMSTDPKRTLMEEGGRISDLQKLVKLNSIQRGQAGAGLGRINVDEGDLLGKSTGGQKGDTKMHFLSSRSKNYPGLKQAITAGMYTKTGYPYLYGLTGIPADAAYNVPNLLRALEQGTDLHRETAKDIWEGPDDIADWIVKTFPNMTKKGRELYRNK